MESIGLYGGTAGRITAAEPLEKRTCGDALALPAGLGKTTIINLLMRFAMWMWAQFVWTTAMLARVRVRLRNDCGVMLRLPPVLILDEATSSIDTRTEQKVQSAFARLMQGRTSIVVAHRLSTIREADVILVMKDGRIIERGRHEELLRQIGFYANLYQSQFVIPNQ